MRHAGFLFHKFNQLILKNMTKKEIQELKDIVMNAKAREVNTGYSYSSGIEFTYAIGNFTATFFSRLHDESSARDVFFKMLLKRARASEPRKNIPKKELDWESKKSQEHLLWWKDNISKMDDVVRVEERWKEFDKKWEGIKFVDMTDIQCKERKSEHKLIKIEENKLGIGSLNIHLLMNVIQKIPKSWM